MNFFDTNEYPNIFVSKKLTQTNIRIHLYPKNDTNEYPSKYSDQKYSNIQIYLSHSGINYTHLYILKFTAGRVYLNCKKTSDRASEIIIILIVLRKKTLFCALPKTTLPRTIQRTTLFESLSNSLHNSFYKLSSRKKFIETDMECSFLCPLIHSSLF